MTPWIGPGGLFHWHWRGYIYRLHYHSRCLPFFWPFTMSKTITEAGALQRAQAEIEERVMAKRERATKFLRTLHGIPERHP